MSQPTPLRAVLLAVATLAAGGACDNRHLVGEGPDAGAPSGAAGTSAGSTGVAGVMGASTGLAGVMGASSGLAGVMGASSGAAGVTGASTGLAGGPGVTGAAGTSSEVFPLPIPPSVAIQRAGKVLWGDPLAQPRIVPSTSLLTNLDVRPSVLDALLDARARTGLGAFYRWWLGLDELATTLKDANVFPGFSFALAKSMAAESETFGVNVTLEGDGLFATLMRAPYSYIDEPLASIYGIAGVTGPALRKVDLDATKRAGILTQPAFLSLRSHRIQTSPTWRGLFISRSVLCQDIPPPPPNVPPEPPPTPTPQETMRQTMERLAATPVCTACHRLMDPIGFAFEGLDAIGRVRATDNGLPVDTSGSLRGATFTGPVELGALLASDPDAQRCMAQQWMRFALGRPLTDADNASIDEATRAFHASGHRLRDLIVAVLTSRAFLAP